MKSEIVNPKTEYIPETILVNAFYTGYLVFPWDNVHHKASTLHARCVDVFVQDDNAYHRIIYFKKLE